MALYGIPSGQRIYRVNGNPFINVPKGYDDNKNNQLEVKYEQRWKKHIYYENNKTLLDVEGLKKEYLGAYNYTYLNNNSVSQNAWERMLFNANKDGLPDNLMKILIKYNS